KTPGHPEYGLTPGVEATTGPLGQGFAMGVGMAIAEAFLAATFNEGGEEPLVDHYTYAIVSDGDLMEGIASEAASLAAHLGLGKLVYLYDDNHITIDGDTGLAFSERVGGRFEAYGWHVQAVPDGNDLDAIEAAIDRAKKETARPSIICVRTHIGFGSPKQDTASVHGEALGAEAMAATKDTLGWPQEPAFHVPDEAREHFGRALGRGEEAEDVWEARFAKYRKTHPEGASRLERLIRGKLPDGWDESLPVFAAGEKMATRAASGRVLNALAKSLPTLIGGSADLAPSNKTYLAGLDAFSRERPGGRNVHFGVREHAMGGVVNGMALHGGVQPYGGTFLVFSDYMRPAIRLSALMDIPSIFVFTHDSVALGEDGPTHQPVEHVASLRAIPNLVVIRPADANETAAAWKVAVEQRGPVALALSRQGLPTLDPEHYPVAEGVPRGAYTLVEASGVPDVILIASGSEVALILEARAVLEARGIQARAVSMPSWELFDQQPADYRGALLPAGIPKVAVEAGSPLGWRDYTGDNGAIIAIDRFGASAPGGVALEKLGFTVDRVVKEAAGLAAG
ncbi:MAG: transketolase, partial [Candidatus Krumholzibacteriia bacterium]